MRGRNRLEKQKVTIKDVARHAGVALGTVDRVLNSTGFVSDKKRELVLKTVKELNYVPNKVARALCKHKQTNIAVIYPHVEEYFWEQINRGIKKAEKQFEAYGLRIVRGFIKSYGVREQEIVIDELTQKNEIHGLAFVPVHTVKLNPYIDKLTDGGIPVVTFDSDAPDSKRLCFIGEDNKKGGCIAGKLMAIFLGGKGRVSVMRAQRDLSSIQQRITGFADKITSKFPGVEIAGYYDIYDNVHDNADDIVHDNMDDNVDDLEKSIFFMVQKILELHRGGVEGLLVTNALVDMAGRAVKRLGGAERIRLIGFDYSDETGGLIKEDVISATIASDLESEGYLAIKTLYEYLTERKIPESDLVYMKHEIIIKETMS